MAYAGYLLYITTTTTKYYLTKSGQLHRPNDCHIAYLYERNETLNFISFDLKLFLHFHNLSQPSKGDVHENEYSGYMLRLHFCTNFSFFVSPSVRESR